MKKHIPIFALIFILPTTAFSQNWEEMAQYTLDLTSRIDSSDLWMNDSVRVQILDYGINEFTIFVSESNRYFIYRCACDDTAVSLIGGRDRIDDYYRMKDTIKSDDKWIVTSFNSEIALSSSWKTIETIPPRKRNKTCLMNIN